MPLARFTHRLLAGQWDRYTAVVEALPDDALMWRPGDGTTNSVAQIVRHVLAYQDFFLETARVESPIRDQAAFEQMHEDSLRDDPVTRAELLEIIAAGRQRMDAHYTRLEAMDITEQVPAPSGRTVERLTILTRAPVHAGEHLGHAELTKQLWAQHRERKTD